MAQKDKPPKFPEHGEAREYWRKRFLERKGINYVWSIKEGKRLNEVLEQIRNFSKEDPLTVFKQIVELYPEWWLQNAYTLHSLSTHFNRITGIIKGNESKQTGVSQDYLQRLAKKAAGQ